MYRPRNLLMNMPVKLMFRQYKRLFFSAVFFILFFQPAPACQSGLALHFPSNNQISSFIRVQQEAESVKSQAAGLPGDLVLTESDMGRQVADLVFDVSEYYEPYSRVNPVRRSDGKMSELMRVITERIRDELKNNLPQDVYINLIKAVSHLVPNAIDSVFLRIDRSRGRHIPEEAISFKLYKNDDTGIFCCIMEDKGAGIPRRVFDGWAKNKFVSTKNRKNEDGRFIGHGGAGIKIVLDTAKQMRLNVLFETKIDEGLNFRFTQDDIGRRRALTLVYDKGEIGTRIVISGPIVRKVSKVIAPATGYSFPDFIGLSDIKAIKSALEAAIGESL